jgi:hypothetical protein
MFVGVAYLMTVHGLSNWLTAVLESRGFASGIAATATSGFVVMQAVETFTIPQWQIGSDGAAASSRAAGSPVQVGLACCSSRRYR